MSAPFFLNLRLKTRLQLGFLLIALLSIGVTGWQSFENARASIEALTAERLTALREIKRRQIEEYFHRVDSQMLTLAEDRTIIEALGAQRVMREASGQTLDEMLTRMCARFEYADLVLAQPSGRILAAAHRQAAAADLLTSPWHGTGLARAFSEAARACGTTDGSDTARVRFIDFAPFVPCDSIPAAFLSVPVCRGTSLLGVVIARLSVDGINRVMTGDKHWVNDGLGRTGETYIVGGDFLMRTDSRFFIEDSSRYLASLMRSGADQQMLSRVTARRTSILLQMVRTDAAVAALHGATGTHLIRDYRGIEVLSSFTPLAIPGVRWILLAEIDSDEAFGPVYALRERLVLAALIILLVAAAFAFTLSRTISRPVLALADAAERLGSGELSMRADATARDEIGDLARAFNAMAGRVSRATALLQAEVSERTSAQEELRRSREQFRDLSHHLQSAREEERKMIAREIHDELGQALTTFKLSLALLAEELSSASESAPAAAGGVPVADGTRNGDRVEKRLRALAADVDATIAVIRRIITELRPGLLDDLGLVAAIEWQAGEFERRTGIACTLTLPEDDVAMAPDCATALFRIFQETLTNVARHAEASHVDVVFRLDEGMLELRITDNGRGISEKALHDPVSYGLLGMRERAGACGGSITFRRADTGGTLVAARIPLFTDGRSPG